MKKAVIFAKRVNEESSGIVFVGYIDSALWIGDESKALSRAHRQTNRIHGIFGIHPAISATEVQGRYYIAYEEDSA